MPLGSPGLALLSNLRVFSVILHPNCEARCLQTAAALLGLEALCSLAPTAGAAKFALGPERGPGAAALGSEGEEAKALSPFRPHPGARVLVFLLPLGLKLPASPSVLCTTGCIWRDGGAGPGAGVSCQELSSLGARRRSHSWMLWAPVTAGGDWA